MATDMMDGLMISVVIVVAWIVMSPILCWVLPDRSHEAK